MTHRARLDGYMLQHEAFEDDDRAEDDILMVKYTVNAYDDDITWQDEDDDVHDDAQNSEAVISILNSKECVSLQHIPYDDDALERALERFHIAAEAADGPESAASEHELHDRAIPAPSVAPPVYSETAAASTVEFDVHKQTSATTAHLTAEVDHGSKVYTTLSELADLHSAGVDENSTAFKELMAECVASLQHYASSEITPVAATEDRKSDTADVDPLYDDVADDEDEAWTEQAYGKRAKDVAVLSCPMCFAALAYHHTAQGSSYATDAAVNVVVQEKTTAGVELDVKCKKCGSVVGKFNQSKPLPYVFTRVFPSEG